MSEQPEGIRLQKVLSAAGVASRRAAEELIDEGRVEVNGKVVSHQGMRVNPDRDQIRVDGERIPPPRRHRYIVFNKPRGVVSTMDDPGGRETLADYLPGNERLFHVGRLDTDTQGLLLMTNDGEFANRLEHPKYEVPKTYLAQVKGLFDEKTLGRLRKGIMLEDGPIKPDKLRIVSTTEKRTMVEVTLHEGRNRIVRRMLAKVGHPVWELSRTRIGPVRLGRLAVGEWRDLTREELGKLLDLVHM
jgi:23S rRNA pseudouridine2605 synthase